MSNKFEFMNPDFKPDPNNSLPNIGPHSFSSGVAFERHQQLVEGVIRGLRLKPEQISDLTQLMSEFSARIKVVSQYGHLVESNIRDMGRDVNRKQMAEELQSKLMDNFMHYSKDQLVTMLTVHLCQLIMEEIV